MLGSRVVGRILPALLVVASGVVSTTAMKSQNAIRIDATGPAPAPQAVQAKLGSDRKPNGETLQVNSSYLMLDGKPWLPVMGEIHYSRIPDYEWESEILKMKAAGVNVVATYVIWIHHEETQGVFNWSGQRDLRKFVQLCGKHGIYAYPRIGPWAHAEARNGGLPDWVLKNSPTRENHPVYLREVDALYAQIAKQLDGLLWKDGGPVIGIQLENEYAGRGPGKGEEHIRTLKSIALQHGLDVPLYTVTGWDNAAIPLDTALPVFGGYPDAPWDGSAGKFGPAEVYAFRFTNRSAGSMGAIGSMGQGSADDYRGTPFLTAEVGGGIQDTYFRRPVVTPDDIAAMGPVMLGSGANLLGYYMFHGGRNPDGGDITLQESQRTGYPTDVPTKSYDFQAPISEYGEERESLRKMKLLNYFLNDFGSILAPMAVRVPDKSPSGPADVTMVRVSARTLGDAGFVFINNYIRQNTMPARPGFQIVLKLPTGTLAIPETAITLPSGVYGIWPVNFDLNGTRLVYSTAQLMKNVGMAEAHTYFFFSIPGIDAEWMFAAGTKVTVDGGKVSKQESDGGLRVRVLDGQAASLHLADGTRLVVLPQPIAETVWRSDQPSTLLSTDADVYSDGSDWTIESTAAATFSFGVFGNVKAPTASVALKPAGTRNFFSQFTASVPTVHLTATVTNVAQGSARGPAELGPPVSWRKDRLPMAPETAEFAHAAEWKITLPIFPHEPALSDVFLRISYSGDVARLLHDGSLLDDDFWNGTPWTVGLGTLSDKWRTSDNPLQLKVLARPQGISMFLEQSARSSGGATLQSLTLVPRYRLDLHMKQLQETK